MRKNPTIAEDLVAGFTVLADALKAGEDLRKRFNCYTKRLDLRPETYTPAMVRQARTRLGASQSVFARFLGVSPKSVSLWERGVSQPNPTACRFMDEIRRNPGYYVKRLQESMVPKHGRTKKAVETLGWSGVRRIVASFSPLAAAVYWVGACYGPACHGAAAANTL